MVRFCALLMVGASLCHFPSPAFAESKDTAALRGVWVLETVEREGETLGLAEKGDRFTLTQDRITIDSSQAANGDWEYRLDDAQSPKQFDLTPIRRKRAKDRFTLLGIYKLEADRLTICVADPGGLLAKAKDRPADFKPGPTQTLLTFVRQEP